MYQTSCASLICQTLGLYPLLALQELAPLLYRALQ